MQNYMFDMREERTIKISLFSLLCGMNIDLSLRSSICISSQQFGVLVYVFDIPYVCIAIVLSGLIIIFVNL